jgi:chromosome segregation ATPase
MRPIPILLLVLVAAAAARPAVARAADSGNESRLRDALRSATAQVRTLEDERATLQARQAALQKEVEALRDQVAAAKRAAAQWGAQSGKVAGLKAQLGEEADARAKLAASLAKCEAAAQATSSSVRAEEAERARVENEVASLKERLAQTEARNARMYQVGKDILDWLDKLGFGAALAAREPFLGLKRVELENTAQDFEDKLLAHKVKP